MSTEYIPDELPEPMKASELAALLMKHPDAIVYVDYIPYDRGCNFSVEYNESTNTLILES